VDQAVSSGEADPAAAALVAHRRLLAGDRVASEELARLLLSALVAKLARRWPKWKHTDVLYDTAVDVFMDYIDAPERYDAGRGPLIRWLELAAHRDLVNLYRSNKQRLAIETQPLSAIAGTLASSGELPSKAAVVGAASLPDAPESVDRLDRVQFLGRIRAVCPDERERKLIWAHWVEGERSSERLAQIIGVDHLPVDQRRRKVKNACDVARRKLKRLGLTDGID